jgi:phosphoribosylformylglycinamidine synthase
MLSESQERMLIVAEKGKEDIVKKIFDKWDLNCVRIGEVIDEDRVLIYYKGHLEADVPAYDLVLGGGAPVYVRNTAEPAYLKNTRAFNTDNVKEPDDLKGVLLSLLSSPNIANKNWVYEQYDTQVRTNTILMPGSDASVIRLKKSKKALSMKVDCNSKYCYLDPYRGGLIAVCESARNVVCTGALPLAITNCLNFGNPYNPEMYFQFTECVRGIGDACRYLDTPVTGGNVSFYNLSKDYAVFPTPVIGMLGLIEDSSKIMTSNFKNEGDDIFILGNNRNEIGGSEYLDRIHGIVSGRAPEINLEEEKSLQSVTLELIDRQLINSAHDISEGGLAAALAESCVMKAGSEIGAVIKIDFNGRKDFSLFGESQSRIIISASHASANTIKQICDSRNVSLHKIGVAGGNSLKINEDISVGMEEISNAYFNSIVKIMQSD